MQVVSIVRRPAPSGARSVDVLTSVLNRYETREVGGREHVKYWIPASNTGFCLS